ncbi:MAG: hypothetical protein AAF871_02010 [Pseudomonadota bacterium]
MTIWWLLVPLLIVIPFWKMLPRYGISKYFALLAALPAVALVLLWIVAFKPDLEDREE